jgi:rfaE bifunctional protein nucleotidyltransferase chain/domain
MRKVFTNGCFDLLHIGHEHVLKEAAKLGRLYVGLNSDASVKKLKGSNRPTLPEEKRKEELLRRPYVHEVHIFEEDTPYDLIKKLKPDIIVKGGDYTKEEIIGKDLVKEVRIIPLLGKNSTTKILKNKENSRMPKRKKLKRKKISDHYITESLILKNFRDPSSNKIHVYSKKEGLGIEYSGKCSTKKIGKNKTYCWNRTTEEIFGILEDKAKESVDIIKDIYNGDISVMEGLINSEYDRKWLIILLFLCLGRYKPNKEIMDSILFNINMLSANTLIQSSAVPLHLDGDPIILMLSFANANNWVDCVRKYTFISSDESIFLPDRVISVKSTNPDVENMKNSLDDMHAPILFPADNWFLFPLSPNVAFKLGEFNTKDLGSYNNSVVWETLGDVRDINKIIVRCCSEEFYVNKRLSEEEEKYYSDVLKSN